MPKYLFVTGKLAAQALEKVLSALALDGGYRMETLGITVASLMTTEFIARHLRGVGEEVLVIPGLCQGPVEIVEQTCHCRVLRGPNDLQELPLFFGAQQSRASRGSAATRGGLRGTLTGGPAGEGAGATFSTEPRLRILAEIVDAPRLTVAEILDRAAYFRASGAGIIDIGTDVYGEFGHLAEAVSALKDRGYRVSIDSLQPKDILTAVNAGADMVLSLNSSNLAVAADLDCPLVLIPDDGGDLPTLLANAERLLALGKQVVIDPLLPPLLLGFTDGILRYAAVRKQFPNVPMLMGCGNVTELADADSTGLNAVLIALATELDIDYVLTTEASPRTRGAVKEIDRARRLMHAAKEWGVVPKHLDDSLLTIKDPATPSCTEAELREMQSLVTDANYRIFTAEGRICVFNAHRFICHPDAASVGNELALTDPAHAFYLGKELYKAELALRLGKKYVQDSELRWGYLSDAHSDL